MPQKLFLLFLLCSVCSSARSAEPPPSNRKASVTLSLVRMPQTLPSKFHLPVASAKSRGVQKVFSRDEYRLLLERFAETSGVEVYPMPRLVAGDGKETSAEMVKEFYFPARFEASAEYPNLHVPDEIDSTNLGVYVAIKPRIANFDSAYLRICTRLCRLLGYKTPAGRLVRVSSPRPKSEWLQELTQWRMPAGVSSPPIMDSSQGGTDSLLNKDQILLVHGFSDDNRKVTYFSVGLEILP